MTTWKHDYEYFQVINVRTFLVKPVLVYKVSETLDIKINDEKSLAALPIENFPGPYREEKTHVTGFSTKNFSIPCKLEFEFFSQDAPLNYSVLIYQSENDIPYNLPLLRVLQLNDRNSPSKYTTYFTYNNYNVNEQIKLPVFTVIVTKFCREIEDFYNELGSLYIKNVEITGYKHCVSLSNKG